jgi:hypothetical protein
MFYALKKNEKYKEKLTESKKSAGQS